jgi:hypothetical protein
MKKASNSTLMKACSFMPFNARSSVVITVVLDLPAVVQLPAKRGERQEGREEGEETAGENDRVRGETGRIMKHVLDASLRLPLFSVRAAAFSRCTRQRCLTAESSMSIKPCFCCFKERVVRAKSFPWATKPTNFGPSGNRTASIETCP